MTASVVAISREHGAGGEQVGALVAERLGFRYVDDEIVAGACITHGGEIRNERAREAAGAAA